MSLQLEWSYELTQNQHFFFIYHRFHQFQLIKTHAFWCFLPSGEPGGWGVGGSAQKCQDPTPPSVDGRRLDTPG